MKIDDGLYGVLDVPRDADQNEIKHAYRKLAQKNHPDREGGSLERMQAIQQAYDVLSDEEKRAHYDRTGQTGGPPNYRQLAVTALTDLISQMIDAGKAGNIVDNCIEHASLSVSQLKTGLYDFQKKEIRLEKELNRVIKKNGGENLFTMVIDGKLTKINAHIQQHELGIKITEEVLVILGEYEDQNPTENKSISIQDMINLGMFGQNSQFGSAFGRSS